MSQKKSPAWFITGCSTGFGRQLAQARYAAGTREILECWFADRPIRDDYLIVEGGKLAGTGAHSYTVRETPKSLAVAR